MSGSLFQDALGAAWPGLPPALRDFHGSGTYRRFVGRADITAAATWPARLAAWTFGFPPAGTGVRLALTIRRDGLLEHWERSFDGQDLHSTLRPGGPGGVWEAIGIARFEMAPHLESDVLHLPIRRGRLLGIPVPRGLLPISDAREFERQGRFHFDIGVSLPMIGRMIRYRGWLEPEEGE